jgi:hypothetical protein
MIDYNAMMKQLQGNAPVGGHARMAMNLGGQRESQNVLDMRLPTDKNGRFIVPNDWTPPPGFTGSVIKNGMQIDYTSPWPGQGRP